MAETWLFPGDCLDVLRTFPDASVDALVTDPPASINFMGKHWDRFVGPTWDAGFAHWLAGFVDGEGCFRIHREKGGDYYACHFQVKLRADDRPVLERIRRFLGVGRIYEIPANTAHGRHARPAALYLVQSRDDCQRIASFFDAVPLRAKKARDYRVWREALVAWCEQGRGNRWHGAACKERMKAAWLAMKHVREYRDEPAYTGNPFVDALVPIFAEVLRVLKPGAHGLVWALPRTSHWTATALEDAGFEVRDVITHHFGCLPAGDDILTEHGWKDGATVGVGERVAAWDSATGAIRFVPVLEHFLKPYKGDLVRIANDDTEQLLTPEHRVYRKLGRPLWRREEWSAWEAVPAATLRPTKPSQKVVLPLGGEHDGPGIGGEDYAAFLGWVWTEGGFDKAPSTGVRIYQTNVNPEHVAEIDGLCATLAPGVRRYARERAYPTQVAGNAVRKRGTYLERTWFFTGDTAQRVRADLPEKRPTWSLLWRMTLGEKRAFLAAAMKGDGAQDARAFAFYQRDQADREWFQTLLHVCGMSGRLGAKACVYGRTRATTEMQAAQWRRCEPARVAYRGDVWCVRVGTGAFLARHAGRIFITGNSGFPKSLDVSKAIDKAAGAEREKLKVPAAAVRNPKTINGGHGVEGGDRPWMREAVARGFHEVDGDKPVTDAAKAWNGWGTALKPATEHWILVRKPLAEGTVAANVLRYGTGALNVDGCRVGLAAGEEVKAGLADPANRKGVVGQAWQAASDKDRNQAAQIASLERTNALGRWPANLILSHAPSCREVGVKRVPTSTDIRGAGPLDGRTSYALGGNREVVGYADADGMETVPAWECVPGCPVAELDAQSGWSTTRPHHGGGDPLDTRGMGWGFRRMPSAISDTGGASRFFPNFAPDDGVPFLYQAKASRSEREAGLREAGLPEAKVGSLNMRTDAHADRTGNATTPARNTHPTVKPVALMRWLCRLVTPPGGTVLDPFMGSGTTGVACVREGLSFLGVEREAEYLATAEARIAHARRTPETKAKPKAARKPPDDAAPLFAGVKR